MHYTNTLLIFLLTLLGCRTAKTIHEDLYYLNYIIEDTIAIPVVKNQRIIAEKPKIIETDSGAFLVFIDTWHSDLVFFSFEK